MKPDTVETALCTCVGVCVCVSPLSFQSPGVFTADWSKKKERPHGDICHPAQQVDFSRGGFDSLASTLYIPNFPYYTCAIFHPVNQRGHSGMDVYLKKTLLISRKIMHLALCLQPPNKTLVPQLHAGTDALLRQKKHVVPTGSACVFQHWVMGVLFVTSQRDNFQNLKSTPWKAALARKVKKKKKRLFFFVH